MDETPVAPWLRATLADIEGLDFEQVIAGSNAADSRDLGDLYRAASGAIGEKEGNDLPDMRVWDFLWAVAGMYFKPDDLNEPFGPMSILPDGRRSAQPSDFREHVDLLQALAAATSNVVLRARLSDLAWLLDRKQPAFGVEALKSYVDLVRRIEAGELKFGDDDGDWQFAYDTKAYLLRALSLARMLGWSKPEADAARAQLVAVRKRAVAARVPVPVHWYCELDLQMRVSDPLEVAAEIEEVLSNLPEETSHHIVADLWLLASRAYQAGKKEDDKQRCQAAVAEVMVAEAEKIASPLLASHLISNAIAALHGVANARPRRTELRHRLVDVQAHLGEEMPAISQEIDLNDFAVFINKKFSSISINESLFLFSRLNKSPDPEKLREEAIEKIRNYPLSSLFDVVQIDDEGKVISRTSGGGFGDLDESAIARQIAHAESLRRSVSGLGQIDMARRAIISSHYLSDDIFYTLTSQSPFVPQDLARTFACGLNRFFQGDFTSALYILTPLLENSLRYVLKSHGHDVATFDDADQTQEDRSITALFSGMRTEMDVVFTPAITGDIERVFLRRPGPALRHGVAHGLLHDNSPYGADGLYACWLIYTLCILPLWPYRQQLGLM